MLRCGKGKHPPRNHLLQHVNPPGGDRPVSPLCIGQDLNITYQIIEDKEIDDLGSEYMLQFLKEKKILEHPYLLYQVTKQICQRTSLH